MPKTSLQSVKCNITNQPYSLLKYNIHPYCTAKEPIPIHCTGTEYTPIHCTAKEYTPINCTGTESIPIHCTGTESIPIHCTARAIPFDMPRWMDGRKSQTHILSTKICDGLWRTVTDCDRQSQWVVDKKFEFVSPKTDALQWLLLVCSFGIK